MRIILTGGGTLGSVTPLLALAEEIRGRNIPADFLWIGTTHGPEKELVQREGIEFTAIPSGKLRRYADWQNFVAPFLVIVGFIVALAKLSRRHASVVVSAGSFVSVPVAYAAALLRMPVIIYQSDKRPGLANRLVSPAASKILLAFAETSVTFLKEKTAVIGNPVRKKVEAAASDRELRQRGREYFHVPEGVPAILVLGGSSGARVLNELVIAALPELTEFAQIIHVIGKWKDATIAASERYRSCTFLHDELPLAYAASDIVVSRAGMGTIGELALLGKPVILIPMRGSHQEENAEALAIRRAAVVLPQPVMTEAFVKAIRELVSQTSRREALGSAIHSIFPPNGRARFADVVLEVAGQK